MSTLSDLIGVIVPGGLAAASVLMVQAVRSWREGKNSRDETILQRWQRIAKESEARARHAEDNGAYAEERANHFRQYSADLEYVMRKEGVTVPPPPPLPERKSRNAPTLRGKRTVRQDADEEYL